MSALKSLVTDEHVKIGQNWPMSVLVSDKHVTFGHSQLMSILETWPYRGCLA